MTDLFFSDPELAALYDALSPRAARYDFDFYRPLAMGAAAVLDIGCGTGTFLHELRRAGHAGRLCGLDPADGMLALARQDASIDWRRGRLPSAGFRDAFELVVMTGHAFQALLEDDEIRVFLRAVHAALAEDGCLAFESRNPAARGWEHWARDYAATVQAADGSVVEVSCRIEGPFDGRCLSFSQVFVSAAWPKPRLSRSTLRFLGVADLNAFLAAAGFVVVGQYGDWDRSPVTASSPEIITLARRA